jgi:hypothetical protein
VTDKLTDEDIKEIDNKFWSKVALENMYREIHERKCPSKSEDKK